MWHFGNQHHGQGLCPSSGSFYLNVFMCLYRVLVKTDRNLYSSSKLNFQFQAIYLQLLSQNRRLSNCTFPSCWGGTIKDFTKKGGRGVTLFSL